MLEATSAGSLPLALPMKESIRLSPSSSNSERTFFKAYLVLTFSGTISSSIFLALATGFGAASATAAAGFFVGADLASVAAGLAASVFFLVLPSFQP